MNNPTILVTSKEEMLNALDKMLDVYQVAALTHKQDRILYDYISKSSDIEWGYHPTVLSPKKFMFPQEEVILDYTADGKVAPRIESKPTVLFGIRPCDLNAIKILDEAFADGHGDPNYLSRREQMIIIGMDCKKLCDQDSFCYKVNTHVAQGGYDIMLYDMGDQYGLLMATEKGKEFVEKFFTAQEGTIDLLEKFMREKQKNFNQERPFKNLEKFPELFEANQDHEVWEEEGSRCLSCGSCIMVCPSCYCFDVADELALSLKKGERLRRWDACMLSSFATVAGGENFRHSATQRLHHRISRKFNFLMKKHGMAVCVGCGRCIRACLADISPKTIAEAINGERGAK